MLFFLLWLLLLMMMMATSTPTKTTMTMSTSKSAKETFPSLSSSIFFIVISIRSWIQGLTIGVGVIIIKLSPSPPHLHRPQGPDKNLCQQFQGEFYNQTQKTWLMGFIIKKGECYDISIEKSNLADHACLQHCQHLLPAQSVRNQFPFRQRVQRQQDQTELKHEQM